MSVGRPPGTVGFTAGMAVREVKDEMTSRNGGGDKLKGGSGSRAPRHMNIHVFFGVGV
jgi:hypothetical protein